MQVALMGIGIAGAGKTTLLKALAQRHGFEYISRDNLAEELTGNPHDQGCRGTISNLADTAAVIAFARGRSVVLDSTFADSEKRCRKTLYLRMVGADRVIGIIFDTPLAIASARNRARKFVVPESVIASQHRQLVAHPPSIADGFDRLYRAEEIAELERTEFAYS